MISERRILVGLMAAGALAFSPIAAISSLGLGPDRTHMQGERGEVSRAGLQAFREERSFDEAQLLRALFSGLHGTRGGSGATVHRSAGARAHRRWAHGRASGRAGASRS